MSRETTKIIKLNKTIAICKNKTNVPKIGLRNENTINYVLGKFRTEEQEIIDEVINSIPRVIYSILSNGFDVAMNEYNGYSIKT